MLNNFGLPSQLCDYAEQAFEKPGVHFFVSVLG